MARIWLLLLAGIAMASGGPSSARAETAPTRAGCVWLFGDIRGEGKATVPKREIDGASIQTVADFMRVTGTREAGLKIINGGDFSGWEFSQIPLANICFHNSKLAGANFAGARARDIGFINSDLTGSSMRGSQMPGILFRNANLTKVMAQAADFSGGHFDGGWFEGGVGGWNIDGADTTWFVFDCGITVPDGCPVDQGGAPISAAGADFARATLHIFGLHNIELTGANLDQTIIGPRQLPQLAKATIRGDIILRGGDNDVRLTADETQNLMSVVTEIAMEEAQPSFDCRRAASKVEQEICGEYGGDLRKADRDIAALYSRVKGESPRVMASQRAWLKQRNRCEDADYPAGCIRESYSQRKGQLLAELGETEWLARGESALFIDEVLPLPVALRRSELFAKITPALVGASMTEIVIERRNDGLFAIKGSAVGANAHLCSIDASHLYFDQQSGWYIPVSEGPAIPIFRIYDDRLEIFADGQPDYEKYPEASDFMSCGMRARFPETIRIDVSDAVIERHRQSLNAEM